MAQTFEFKRLADVESLTEIPEGANALVEVDGAIKKANLDELATKSYVEELIGGIENGTY